MIDKTIGKLRLKLYSGIDELPAERYHKFNLFTLMAVGIGSDVEGLQNHYAQISQALQRKDYERLKILFANYHHSLSLILEGIDTTSMAFVCLIHSINEIPLTDISDDNLIQITRRISRNVRRQNLINLFNELKKKSRTRLGFISRKG